MTEIRYWKNDDRPWEFEVTDADTLWHEANYAVGQMYDIHDGRAYVDELALLVPNREMAAQFIMRAVQEGRCSYFASSDDTVHTEPLGTKYDVTYHFLSLPRRPYRLEVMHVNGGHSPLHDAVSRGPGGYDSIPVVHASFKPVFEPDTENGYDDARELLWRKGFRPSQECESDYGRFGYWRKPGAPLLFLKPRVNLRDNIISNYPLPPEQPAPVVLNAESLPKRQARSVEDLGVEL